MSNPLPGLFWALLLFLYCSLIFFLSHQPALPVPHVFDMQDKLIHGAAYGLMAGLFWRAFHPHLAVTKLAIVTVLFCSLYGFSDEWHQSFIEGRQADVFDWLADTLGAFLLTWMLYKWEPVRMKGDD